jgi:hypothetical protein
MTSSSKSRASKSPAAEKKLEHPAKEFSNPTEVLTDRSLSTRQKQHALDALEQDARQLAVASSEGMAGGERTNLRNVLEAERSLEPTPADPAFTEVLRTLEDQRHKVRGTDTDVLITRAIDAINEACAAIQRQEAAPVPPPGAPEAGSKEELQEEINKEKLDPGA